MPFHLHPLTDTHPLKKHHYNFSVSWAMLFTKLFIHRGLGHTPHNSFHGLGHTPCDFIHPGLGRAPRNSFHCGLGFASHNSFHCGLGRAPCIFFQMVMHHPLKQYCAFLLYFSNGLVIPYSTILHPFKIKLKQGIG